MVSQLSDIVEISTILSQIADKVDELDSNIKATKKAQTELDSVKSLISKFRDQLASEEIKIRDDLKTESFWKEQKQKKQQESKPRLLKELEDARSKLHQAKAKEERIAKAKKNGEPNDEKIDKEEQTLLDMESLIDCDFNSFAEKENAVRFLAVLNQTHPTLIGGLFRIISYLFEYTELFQDQIHYDGRNDAVKDYVKSVNESKSMNRMVI